jgi:tetratricopeptide (TPR) repeat protein
MARRLPDPPRERAARRPRTVEAAARKAGAATRWRRWATIARRPGRRLWAVVVGLATVVGLVTGVMALLDNPHIRPTPPSKPAPMLGDLRLAVAPFDSTDTRHGSATPASTTAAARVAAGVADLLTSELAPLRRRLRVELRPPAQLRPLGGTSPVHQAETAATLASQHGADILVHGRLVVDATSTRLEPHVYLADGRPDVDELVGDHKLGKPIVTPGDPASNQLFASELARALAARVRALAALSVGITYYQLGQLDQADQYLALAGQTSGWRKGEGTELLHLVVGNVAARRGADLRRDGNDAAARVQFTRALDAYQAALAVQPGYARALYGIAETHFAQLDLHCQPGTGDNLRQLQQVAGEFAAAGGAPYQPAGANLDLKVDFGIGRVHVCLSHAGANHRAQATAHLTRVLAAVDPPTRVLTPALIRLAAETHGQLGLLALAEPAGPARRPRLQAAVGHYLRAIALGQTYPDRARVFWDNLAKVHDRLGARAAADQARAQAEALSWADRS